MSDLNTATLTGRLAQKPAVFENSKGKIVRFSLATSEQYKVDDEFKERVTFNSIAVYDKFRAEAATKLSQGDFVLVQGSVETHSYEKDGATKYTTEIAVRPGDKLMTLLKAKPKTEPAPGETLKQTAGKRPVQSAKPQPK